MELSASHGNFQTPFAVWMSSALLHEKPIGLSLEMRSLPHSTWNVQLEVLHMKCLSLLGGHPVLDVGCRNTPSLQAALKQSQELQAYAERLVWVEDPVVNNISSSKLRNLLQMVIMLRLLQSALSQAELTHFTFFDEHLMSDVCWNAWLHSWYYLTLLWMEPSIAHAFTWNVAFIFEDVIFFGMQGKSVKYLTPDSVLNYIKEQLQAAAEKWVLRRLGDNSALTQNRWRTWSAGRLLASVLCQYRLLGVRLWIVALIECYIL